MPTFELVSLQEAQLELSLTGKRGAIMREYIDYLNQLESDQAGKLTVGEGDTTAAIRRRLGAAAQLIGKNVVTERMGDVVFVWEEAEAPEAPRRGRRRKASSD